MSASNTTVVPIPKPEPLPNPGAKVVRLRPANMTTDRAVERYLAIRDQIAEIKKEQARALEAHETALELLAGWLLADLNAHGLKSVNTGVGTAYKSTRTSATVENWSETLAYIRGHDAWELLEARVSKLAVAAIMEETQAAIPGVKTSRETVVNVRKSGDRA